MFKVKALSFSEIGKKDNQEDRVFPDPQQVKPDQRYFILCDGMGGHEKGEVASETVSSALGQYFDAHPFAVADEAYFNDALAYAYSRLDLVDTGAEKKMGTTLTCLLLNPNGFLAAHVGDSRIYQFRDGQIVFQTRDHSLVNDLLKAGEITEEEARNHPRKNIITRAMQPNSRRVKADIFLSEDIQPGDIFFLCCDGILERMTNESLCQIMGMRCSATAKLAIIKDECDRGTKDNYTCWLVFIEDNMDPITILEWNVTAQQVKMKDKSGSLYYLENCTPPDGLNAAIVQPRYKYNTLGQLYKDGKDIGPWVLHTNDKRTGVLTEYCK
jgi:protein phosphatase